MIVKVNEDLVRPNLSSPLKTRDLARSNLLSNHPDPDPVPPDPMHQSVSLTISYAAFKLVSKAEEATLNMSLNKWF